MSGLMKPWPKALVILALTCGAYASSLHAPFFDRWDDDFYVTGNPRTMGAGAEGLARLWSSKDTWDGWFLEYFPLRDTVYWATFQLFGLQVTAFHVVNLLWHLLATLLVWRLARRLGFSETVAWVAALLFGTHPVHVESVVWISGLKDPMFTAFMVGALICFCRYRETKAPLQYGLYVGLMVASLLCKSLALGTPLLALAIDRALDPKTPWKTALFRQVGPAIIAAGFLYQFLLIGKTHGVITPPHGGSWSQHYLLMSWALARYLQQALVPATFRIFYCFEPFDGFDVRLLGTLLGLAALAALLFPRRDARARLLGLWFLICLAPVANLVPFPAIMADRYLYAPSIAACIGLAWALDSLPGAFRRVLPALLVTVFAAVTLMRGFVWQNEVNLWTEVIEDASCLKDPSLNSCLMYVAHAKHVTDPTVASRSFRQAMSHSGFHTIPPYDRASIIAYASANELKRGDLAEARRLAEEAVRVAPLASVAWLAKARLPGNPKASVEAAERAFMLEPASQTHLQLGQALLVAGRIDDGVGHIVKAVQMKPLAHCPGLLGSIPRLAPEVRAKLEPLRADCAELVDYSLGKR